MRNFERTMEGWVRLLWNCCELYPQKLKNRAFWCSSCFFPICGRNRWCILPRWLTSFITPVALWVFCPDTHLPDEEEKAFSDFPDGHCASALGFADHVPESWRLAEGVRQYGVGRLPDADRGFISKADDSLSDILQFWVDDLCQPGYNHPVSPGIVPAGRPQWVPGLFLGFKNAFFPYCIIAILVAGLLYLQDRRFKKRAAALMVASFLNVFLAWSASSIVAVMVSLLMFMMLVVIRRPRILQKLNSLLQD